MEASININRLNSAFSKIGNVPFQDKVRLRQLFDEIVSDVQDYLQTSLEEEYKALSPQDKIQITTALNKQVEILLKRHYAPQVHNNQT